MNFRKLIEQAMNELREEFSEIISRKLAALMGDASSPSSSSRRSASVAASPKASSNGRKGGKRGRTRARPDHMDGLRAKVLDALKKGDAMKKSEVLKAARLAAGEGPRVGNVLKRLKDEGVLSMQGTKGSAIYTYKGG